MRVFNFASHDFNRLLKIGITSKSHFAAWLCLFYISTFEKEIYWPGVIGTLQEKVQKGTIKFPFFSEFKLEQEPIGPDFESVL